MREQEDSLALLAAPLTSQERRFVEALTSDPEWSLAAAARAAGYADPKAADRIMRSQAVVRYIAAIQSDQRNRLRDIRDNVVATLWQLASGFDIAGLVEENEAGEIVTLPPNRLPPTLRAAVKSVKCNKGVWEYQFVDRAAVLGLLLKHFGETDRARLGANDAPPMAPKVVVEYPE
jgi:hypothetical protein